MTAGAPRIAKLVVIGVGLIGGSFALALKAAGRVDTVVGVGRGRANLELARSRAASSIARVTLDADWTREIAEADLVLLATPVGAVSGALRRARRPPACRTRSSPTRAAPSRT